MPNQTAALWKALTAPNRLVVIAGPCVIENEKLCLQVAAKLKRICQRLGLVYVFKASFDKANRTSGQSFRGPGLESGLETLARVRAKIGVPVLTDVHSEAQAAVAGEVVDILQIPAFLCRQTDFLLHVAQAGKPVNIKKGQFLAPWDVGPVLQKLASTGNHQLMVTERGASFGYNNLVADMRSLAVMAQFGYPVVYDAGHSVQLPGGQGTSSGGQRQFIRVLARAAVAVGVDGVFLEVHENPEQALSDGPNSYRLEELEQMLRELKRIDALVKKL